MSIRITPKQTQRGMRYFASVSKYHKGNIQQASRTFDSQQEAENWANWRLAMFNKNIAQAPQAIIQEFNGNAFQYAMKIMNEFAAQRRNRG